MGYFDVIVAEVDVVHPHCAVGIEIESQKALSALCMNISLPWIRILNSFSLNSCPIFILYSNSEKRSASMKSWAR